MQYGSPIIFLKGLWCLRTIVYELDLRLLLCKLIRYVLILEGKFMFAP